MSSVGSTDCTYLIKYGFKDCHGTLLKYFSSISYVSVGAKIVLSSTLIPVVFNMSTHLQVKAVTKIIISRSVFSEFM